LQLTPRRAAASHWAHGEEAQEMSIRDWGRTQQAGRPLTGRPAHDMPAHAAILKAPGQLALPLGDFLSSPPIVSQDDAPREEPCELWAREHGELRPATVAEVIAAARRSMTRRVRRGAALDSPRAVREFLALKLGTLEHEIFCVLLLDARHRLIDYVELFRGTIDGASVHPREVVKLALAYNAAALVLAHPHPLCCAASVTTGFGLTESSVGQPL
jgi:hypothetical protein